MTWNYRLCKSTYNDNGYEDVGYHIKEVYYTKDGAIWAVTENDSGIFGETVTEAKDTLRKMQEAFDKEVVDLDTLVFAKPDFEEET